MKPELTPMLVFIDFEFTDLAPDAKLISAGLVTQDGAASFYAELADTWQLSDANEFVIEHVLPKLEGGNRQLTWAELQRKLKRWIENRQRPVQFISDAPSWDWPWVLRLFDFPTNWPANLAYQPVSLQTLIQEAKIDFHTLDALHSHHALKDAEANRQVWLQALMPSI